MSYRMRTCLTALCRMRTTPNPRKIHRRPASTVNSSLILPPSYFNSTKPPAKAPTGPPLRNEILFYPTKPQERLRDGRYETIAPLGGGQYSDVWLARDFQESSYVALKVLTTECYGAGHDIFEIDILAKIKQQQQQLAPEAEDSHVIGMLDDFQLRGPAGDHKCIVLPVLGPGLGRMVHSFPLRRIPVSIAKRIVRQLLTGLAFIHDRCGVIHTDLQPSNICIEIGLSEIERLAAGKKAYDRTSTIDETTRVKIIDFGVSSWTDKHLTDNIQPEHLRAPEVMLGAPWGPPVDIWSLGCLIIQFVQGFVAFPGSASKHGIWTSVDDHFAQQMEVLGPMPTELLERGAKTSEYFDDKGTLLRIPTLKPTSLERRTDGEKYPFDRPISMTAEDLPVYRSFLKSALALDPQVRGTARQLLQHEWLKIQ